MPDSVTVTTRTSFLSRLWGAVTGVVFGCLMFLAAFPLLWWNEGRAVHRARSLAEGAASVMDVPADTVNAANDGRLVHLSGLATTSETLTDTDFDISAQAIRLSRIAETYQWAEHSSSKKRKKLGGAEETVTTYTYSKEWSGRQLDSSSFKSPAGHENPASLQWVSYTLTAERVSLGAFRLSPDLVSKIEGGQPRPPQPSDERSMAAEGFRQLEPGKFFRGRNPSDPQVGDIRVRYEVTMPQAISIVAVQRGDTFEAYQAAAGSSILFLEQGTVPAAQMFKSAQTANTITTWALRAAFFFLMFLGLVLLMRPLSVAGSIIPFLGSIVAAGTGTISFLLALVLSLTTVALAWLFYRPLLGGSLLAAAVVGVVLLVRRARQAKAAKTVVPPPLPPVPPPIPAGQG